MTSNPILNPQILQMLATVNKVFSYQNAEYYIVGAIARDIAAKDAVPARRMTNDIDIAIMMRDEDEFNAVKAALLATGNFTTTAEPIRLMYNNSIELDLLPFGDIENEDREIVLKGKHVFMMNMPGFKEIAAHTETITIGGNVLHTCPLEGIVILKLLANNDRPERTHDITDIEYLINAYFLLHTNDIYDDHADVISMYANEDEYFQSLVSSYVIGRKIR